MVSSVYITTLQSGLEKILARVNHVSSVGSVICLKYEIIAMTVNERQKAKQL